ncbi:hypothetical protein NSK_007127 [Nannochloropsis salina CCMP1776]|uniref:Small ribosomal subunit protein mS29 n=1 Tax=Nannochloropsis salina CCMP1776 TaxID=1027361 RepID=A0A4D9CRT1_9STRA|nr:hypothetical protein NSK_007127 [Nannochloropsis salina CCMP1776]|eukprot:TFJ81880.1 hypothetical protein NSK_007127 [Nannochloropsis salina CCMP1776]
MINLLAAQVLGVSRCVLVMKRLLCCRSGGSRGSSVACQVSALKPIPARQPLPPSISAAAFARSSFFPSSLPFRAITTKSTDEDQVKPPRATGGKYKARAMGKRSAALTDSGIDDALEKELLYLDTSSLVLPPGTQTEGMTVEEMQTLADAYALQMQEKANREGDVEEGHYPEVTSERLDPTMVYAPSDDPRHHVEEGAMGKIYTLSEEEVKRYFPGPWRRPSRVPWLTDLQAVLTRRYLLVRPQAVEVMQNLGSFAGKGREQGRFGGIERVEALRNDWEEKGGFDGALARAKRGEGGEIRPSVAPTPPLGKAVDEEERGEGEERAVDGERVDDDDDEYDLFGGEEDDEERLRAGLGGADGGGSAYEARKTDWDQYGTLKQLAVDDSSLVHPEQRLELPVPAVPTEGGREGGREGGVRSIFLLSGPRGSGKTATLYHAVHYARRSGWVVFFVPSAFEYLHEGGLIRPSPFYRGYFDTPDLAQTTLRQLGEAHGHQFASLPYAAPRGLESLELSGEHTCWDLIALGLSQRKWATTCLLELKRALENQDAYPVLFAVDEVSEWFYPSSYFYARKKIEASRLAVVASLRGLLPFPPSGPGYGKHHQRFAFLAAYSHRYPRRSYKKASKGAEGRKRRGDLPPYPLPRFLAPYDVPLPPTYSPTEFQVLYNFVADQGLWGPQPSFTSAALRQARMISAGHPGTFAKDAVVLERRLFAPQNRVGKASACAPANFMLADLLEDEEAGEGGAEGREEHRASDAQQVAQQM